MTGFGRACTRNGKQDIEVELRTVNHRFVNLKISLPEDLSPHEVVIDRTLRSRIGRGSVLLTVSVKGRADVAPPLPESRRVRDFVRGLRAVQKAAGVPGEITMNALLSFPQLWSVPPPGEAERTLWPTVKRLIDRALERTLRMRRKEGAGIRRDIERRLGRIEASAKLLGERTPRVLEGYQRRLEERINSLLTQKGYEIGHPDVLKEIAIHADRWDISEELQRLGSHVRQFRATLRASGQIGRKLDFLCQEMVRETNTLTAKGNDAEIARIAVEIKAELEKIKEQAENVE